MRAHLYIKEAVTNIVFIFSHDKKLKQLIVIITLSYYFSAHQLIEG